MGAVASLITGVATAVSSVHKAYKSIHPGNADDDPISQTVIDQLVAANSTQRAVISEFGGTAPSTLTLSDKAMSNKECRDHLRTQMQNILDFHKTLMTQISFDKKSSPTDSSTPETRLQALRDAVPTANKTNTGMVNEMMQAPSASTSGELAPDAATALSTKTLGENAASVQKFLDAFDSVAGVGMIGKRIGASQGLPSIAKVYQGASKTSSTSTLPGNAWFNQAEIDDASSQYDMLLNLPKLTKLTMEHLDTPVAENYVTIPVTEITPTTTNEVVTPFIHNAGFIKPGMYVTKGKRAPNKNDVPATNGSLISESSPALLVGSASYNGQPLSKGVTHNSQAVACQPASAGCLTWADTSGTKRSFKGLVSHTDMSTNQLHGAGDNGMGHIHSGTLSVDFDFNVARGSRIMVRGDDPSTVGKYNAVHSESVLGKMSGATNSVSSNPSGPKATGAFDVTIPANNARLVAPPGGAGRALQSRALGFPVTGAVDISNQTQTYTEAGGDGNGNIDGAHGATPVAFLGGAYGKVCRGSYAAASASLCTSGSRRATVTETELIVDRVVSDGVPMTVNALVIAVNSARDTPNQYVVQDVTEVTLPVAQLRGGGITQSEIQDVKNIKSAQQTDALKHAMFLSGVVTSCNEVGGLLETRADGSQIPFSTIGQTDDMTGWTGGAGMTRSDMLKLGIFMKETTKAFVEANATRRAMDVSSGATAADISRAVHSSSVVSPTIEYPATAVVPHTASLEMQISRITPPGQNLSYFIVMKPDQVVSDAADLLDPSDVTTGLMTRAETSISDAASTGLLMPDSDANYTNAAYRNSKCESTGMGLTHGNSNKATLYHAVCPESRDGSNKQGPTVGIAGTEVMDPFGADSRGGSATGGSIGVSSDLALVNPVRFVEGSATCAVSYGRDNINHQFSRNPKMDSSSYIFATVTPQSILTGEFHADRTSLLQAGTLNRAIVPTASMVTIPSANLQSIKSQMDVDLAASSWGSGAYNTIVPSEGDAVVEDLSIRVKSRVQVEQIEMGMRDNFNIKVETATDGVQWESLTTSITDLNATGAKVALYQNAMGSKTPVYVTPESYQSTRDAQVTMETVSYGDRSDYMNTAISALPADAMRSLLKDSQVIQNVTGWNASLPTQSVVDMVNAPGSKQVIAHYGDVTSALKTGLPIP